jgi:hypothetical protein
MKPENLVSNDRYLYFCRSGKVRPVYYNYKYSFPSGPICYSFAEEEHNIWADFSLRANQIPSKIVEVTKLWKLLYG